MRLAACVPHEPHIIPELTRMSLSYDGDGKTHENTPTTWKRGEALMAALRLGGVLTSAFEHHRHLSLYLITTWWSKRDGEWRDCRGHIVTMDARHEVNIRKRQNPRAT